MSLLLILSDIFPQEIRISSKTDRISFLSLGFSKEASDKPYAANNKSKRVFVL